MKNLSPMFNRAVAACKTGDFIEAEKLCQNIIAIKHNVFDALNLLAVIQLRLGKRTEALASYDRALKLRPDYVETLSNRGLILQDLKRLDEALASFDRALELRPDFAAALSNRGVTLQELNRLDEALASLDRALKAKPDYAEALSNRGNILKELKRFDEALTSYDRAINLRPNYAEALSNRGNILQQLKRLDEALGSYDRALKLRPDFAEALYNRGVTLQQLRRFNEALASYDRALRVKPDYAEALYNSGVTLQELKRFDEALASYDHALKLRPDFAEALSNRGVSLQKLKRFDEALASYDRALKVQPDHAETLSNRGVTLQDLKRFDEALASYDRALTVRPDYAEALSNRGNTLQDLKRFDEAPASYDRAIKLKPDYAEALSNRGNTLKELKRFDEALASYDHALKLKPDYALAHWNESLARLLIGDFEHGFNKYEWRWKTESLLLPRRDFARPLWLGADAIDDKTILLHAEQGFGDTIQFCRYVPIVAARCARVILEVPEPLHELMSTLPGAAQIISEGTPLPDFDFHCPLLSLPLALGTRLTTIPSTTPYLSASSQAFRNWEMRLGPRGRPRIGLVWSGNSTHKSDHNRSISLSSLLPLLNVNATFVSLQKDVRAEDAAALKARSDLVHFGDALKDFSDTAALISLLDLVISVDTSVAHLAGALAKPVWVLLPFVPDWRWLLDRDDNPWYPSARLFRQDETRAWDSVIANVHASLHDFAQERS